jgi:50S ribosomal subunit-associated GTPase HflX
MQAIVVGRPNVGKTLLAINLAAYLGLKDIGWLGDPACGGLRAQRLSVERARRDLVSSRFPKTRRVQTFTLDVSSGRRARVWQLIDTVGMAPGIAADADIRRATALTLELLAQAPMVWHLVDASNASETRAESWRLDDALVQWCRNRTHYLVLASKMDKIGAERGLRAIRERYRGVAVVAVSALTYRGFRDLKSVLFKNWPS